jgi:hypothetical protein
MQLSFDQIIALAPDPSSAKSGKELATASKWGLRCSSDKALWGHCQGSGKLPYQTQVDLQNLAFKCSCPSRKFPCKHGLGLLLLYSREPKAFTVTDEPDWVTDWLSKRNEKATKKSEQESKPVDAEAQAKRAGARAKKVADGMDDLQIWLRDLIRNGLINLPERAYEYWQNPARRMVDAQAPGLASMLKSLGNINYFQETWKPEVLSQLTKIYLVSEGYKRIESLPDELAQEVRNQVGFTQSKDELMSQPGVADIWLVLARTIEEDEQLTVERNWLYGSKSNRFALVLQFFVNRQVPEFNLLPGTSMEGELVFYKGLSPLRAIIRQQLKIGSFANPAGLESLSKTLEYFSEIVIQNPFYDWIPVIMDNVRFCHSSGLYFLADSQGDAIKIKATEAKAIKLLAVTGGKPCKIFALTSGETAIPMSVWVGENFIALP